MHQLLSGGWQVAGGIIVAGAGSARQWRAEQIRQRWPGFLAAHRVIWANTPSAENPEISGKILCGLFAWVLGWGAGQARPSESRVDIALTGLGAIVEAKQPGAWEGPDQHPASQVSLFSGVTLDSDQSSLLVSRSDLAH